MIDNINQKRFFHGNLNYDFTFREIEHHLLENVTIGKLDKYINLVDEGKCPNSLFNHPNVPRASRMRIKGLEKVQKNYLLQYLYKNDLVVRLDGDETSIPSMVQEVFKNIKELAINKKPNHEPVLKALLIKDPRSVAIELPVWKVSPTRKVAESITGHIDLIQVEYRKEKYEIKVMDYKPEGEKKFIFMIPQIAIYALMLADKLQPDVECDMNCYIFDKKVVWKFKPDILFKIDDKLKFYGAERSWKPFLDYFT